MKLRHREIVNSACISALLVINAANFTEGDEPSLKYLRNAKNTLETAVNKMPNFSEGFKRTSDFFLKTKDKLKDVASRIDFGQDTDEEYFENDSFDYEALINRALKSDEHNLVDSVIKFVPKDFLREYIDNEAKNSNPNYNRLMLASRTGEEIRDKRFNSGRNFNESLRNMAASANVRPGSFGSRGELKEFLDLYKDDFVEVAKEYDLNPSLLASIASVESRGRTFTISNTGALGAFGQTSYAYMPQTNWFDGNGRDAINPFHTLEAMDRAGDMIRGLIDLYARVDDEHHTLALTTYNQGEAVVNRAIRLARQEGIFEPKKIIQHTNNTRRDRNIFSIATREGRNYSAHIQRENVIMSEYFNTQFDNLANTHSYE